MTITVPNKPGPCLSCPEAADYIYTINEIQLLSEFDLRTQPSQTFADCRIPHLREKTERNLRLHRKSCWRNVTEELDAFQLDAVVDVNRVGHHIVDIFWLDENA